MDSVHNRSYHYTFVHSGRIVIWGGLKTDKIYRGKPSWPSNEIVVYEPESLSFKTLETKGTPPASPGQEFIAAHVVKDDLYVIDDRSDVHKLDLICLNWSMVETTGVRPGQKKQVISWLHGEDDMIVIFYVDGSLEVLSLEDNASWSRPTCRGSQPVHVFMEYFYAFSIGRTAYLLSGGNDMHRLDMESWTWEVMLPDPSETSSPMGTRNAICGRGGQTLTLLPPDQEQNPAVARDIPVPQRQQGARALLYGGWPGVSLPNGNCWMLHLGEGLLYHWSRREDLDAGGRRNHQAVVETSTGQVWMVGGFGNDSKAVRSLVKLTVTRPLSLVVSSFKALVEERNGRLKKGIEELPETLKSKFKAFLQTEVEVS